MLGAKFRECFVSSSGSAWCQVQGVLRAKFRECFLPSSGITWCLVQGVLGAKFRECLVPSSGNAWCHSEQNLLSSSLLSKNIQTKIYRTIILAVVLYGCGTWSLTLSEERRLRVV